MKMPIIAFLLVFILLGGIPSIADDAMSKLSSDSAIEASLSAQNVTTAQNGAPPTPAPNAATMLLVATGMIGLAGVSRGKDS